MKDYLKQCLRDYLATALWSSTDYDGDPLDNQDRELSLSLLKSFISDLKLFIKKVESTFNEEDQYYILNRTGSDLGYLWPFHFWLTRNRHGAGFWDGDWDEFGGLLTNISKSFGEVDLYVGDDGRIYSI